MEHEIFGTNEGHVYDWWSRHPRALDLLYSLAFLGQERTFRRNAIDALSLTPGERVLEVGCGNGNSFAPLRSAIDRNGTVVGLDSSRGMIHSARSRIRSAGWQNVHALRGDACRPPIVDGTFDAAYAAMSISATPDPEQAIRAIEAALRPGGQLVVLDAQPFQQWPWQLANPIIIPISERTTNWVPEIDLVAVLEREFETVDSSVYNGGSIVIAHAKKQSNNRSSDQFVDPD